MRVSHLSVSDFRNYRHSEVVFKPGLNLIIGRNGQGKTNLVEAISYFSSLSSHRVSSDTALIRESSEQAILRMRIAVKEREALCEVQLNAHGRNRAQLNKNPVHPRELTQWFSSVLFAPEDLMIIRGDPSARRQFIDHCLVLLKPHFTSVLSDYDRVLRQRTTLLKTARSSRMSSDFQTTLDVWNEQLVQLGSEIIVARRELIQLLDSPVRSAYFSLVEQDHKPGLLMNESIFRDAERSSGSSTIDGSNVSRETIKTQFMNELARVAPQEFDRGVTLVGPHRDDVIFTLRELPVKGYASHGETWSFALALRLGLSHLLKEQSNYGDPVIILDDVFAELDVRRRNALMSEVSSFEQVIVTAAVEEDVPEAHWHKIIVSAGEAEAIDIDDVSRETF